MTGGVDDTETSRELEPTPWWVGTGEKLLNVALIFAIGAPVATVTGEPIWAAVVGCIGLLVVQAVYWRLYRGEKLTEVYDVA